VVGHHGLHLTAHQATGAAAAQHQLHHRRHRSHLRLACAALSPATPIDEETSDIRVSYYFPRNGVIGDDLPADAAAFAARVGDLYEEDARIWRHQAFVQHPIYALADRAGYSALRKWCEQFYEAPEHQRAMDVLPDISAD
jgi:3-Ketosteroid 9alpha-hydroxylase C-terminal domain